MPPCSFPIVHLQRLPSAAQFSIEGYFRRLRDSLKPDVVVDVVLLPFASRGFWRRVLNLALPAVCAVRFVMSRAMYTTFASHCIEVAVY